MPASNEEFIKQAAARGLTPDQIRQAVAERNSRLSPTPPATSPVTSTSSTASVGETPEKKSIFEQAAGLLGFGTTAKNVKAAAAVPGLRMANAQNEEFQQGQKMRNDMLLERLAKETDPEKIAFLKKAVMAQQEGTQGVQENYDKLFDDVRRSVGASEEDVEGNILKAGIRRGVGSGAEALAFFAPGTKEFKGLKAAAQGRGAAARIANEVATGSVQGGLQGVAEASLEPEDASGKVLRGMAGGGITSGVLQGGAESVNAAASTVNATRGTARQKLKDVYASTLKENVADQKFYQQAGGKDRIIEDAIKFKLPNTKEGVQQELERYRGEFNDIVEAELAKKKSAGQKVDLSSVYRKAKEKTLNALKDPESRGMKAQAEKYFEAADAIYDNPNNKEVTADSVNRLRKRLDGMVGEILQQDITSGEGKAIKNFASTLREEFRKQVPELRDSYRKYELLSGLADAMQKERVLGITEVAAAAASPLTGAATIAEVAGAHAVRSPGLKRKIITDLYRTLSKGKKFDTTRMTPEMLRSVSSIIGGRSAAEETE